VTGEEWSWVESLIPPAKRGGRRREVDVREVLNGLLYVVSTGCQWRYVPKDLPPRSTLYGYLQRWNYDGTMEKVHYALYQECREQIDREASPTACVIDSQSVKSVEKGGARIDPNGYDAGKKINGKKRHILVDTQGLLMQAIVHAADIQDRDGGVLLLASMFGLYPFLANCLLTAVIGGRSFARHWQSNCRSSRWKSSSDPTAPKASRSFPVAGSWSGRSPGSTAAAGWPRTSRTSTVTL
jgi:transposase